MDLASSTPRPAVAGVPGVPSRRMLGEAGIDSARRRVHDCEYAGLFGDDLDAVADRLDAAAAAARADSFAD